MLGSRAPTASCSSAPSRLSMMAPGPLRLPAPGCRAAVAAELRVQGRPCRAAREAGPGPLRPGWAGGVRPLVPGDPSGPARGRKAGQAGRAEGALQPGAPQPRGRFQSRGAPGGAGWREITTLGEGQMGPRRLFPWRNEKLCGSCGFLNAPPPPPVPRRSHRRRVAVARGPPRVLIEVGWVYRAYTPGSDLLTQQERT